MDPQTRHRVLVALGVVEPLLGAAAMVDLLARRTDPWDPETDPRTVAVDPVEVLLTALAELASEARAWDPAKHPRNPKGSGGGRFRSTVDRLKDAIQAHLDGDSDGDPFDGFSREQLRLAAKKRGIPLERGEGRESIAKKLLADLKVGGGPAKPKKARRNRVVGRDRLAEIKADAADIRTDSRSAHFDVEMAEIARRQGFDGPPQVVTRSAVDDAVDNGWIEVWRGVKDGRGVTAAEINERLRSGEFEPGKSSGYGAGVYTSVDRAVAEAYRGAEIKFDRDYNIVGYSGGAEGGLLRMALDPGARVADYDKAVERWKAAKAGLTPDELAVLGDLGRYLAAEGYDAIRVRGHGDGFSMTDPPDQYVILNRTALLVQKEPGA